MIQVIKTAAKMKEASTHLKKSQKSVGYVPTMGYLHEGHLSLVEKAKRENDIVVMSIFVNPLQFGPGEDFDSYPRDVNRDIQLAEEAGVELLFLPSAAEMYRENHAVSVSVNGRTDVLCGRTRPGHFDGVATVLTKLFSIIAPDKAYFGMKDAQQVAVVDALIHDFFMDVELVASKTIREKDGLAKSSRNINLSPIERDQAPYIYQSLQAGAAMIEQGERDPKAVISAVLAHLEAAGGNVEYVECYSYPELKKQDVLSGKIIIAAAVKYSKARLIDNIVLTIS
ncbi:MULTISPECIES: pantoate--beta-alanine ligase [Bacillus]|uniref:Pantothenate synthetase n=1 Tax=Bacillus capparidis TaxID=1840411 RepID=A0ABS4CS76_9BACI|nr:pantoate--beta-alanine ligase [Bacillus capparidis]